MVISLPISEKIFEVFYHKYTGMVAILVIWPEIFEHFCSPIPLSLHIKFGFDGLVVSEENMFEGCGRRMDCLYYKLTHEPNGWDGTQLLGWAKKSKNMPGYMKVYLFFLPLTSWITMADKPKRRFSVTIQLHSKTICNNSLYVWDWTLAQDQNFNYCKNSYFWC